MSLNLIAKYIDMPVMHPKNSYSLVNVIYGIYVEILQIGLLWAKIQV